MWLAGAMVVASWAVVLQVPTFDLDESLYRRLAEEMKIRGSYFVPTWDGRPFYEKPPTYFWTILLSSVLFDPSAAPVSIFSSRLPSLLFTLVVVTWLGAFWPRFLSLLEDHRSITMYPEWLRHPALPVVLYSMALLPSVGASSVLLDPMLTAFLTPVLLILSGLWLEGEGTSLRRPTTNEAIVLVLGLAGATAVKGLVGLILPAFAVVMHSVLATGIQSPMRAVRALWEDAKRLCAAFAAAVLVASGFYLLVYWKAGEVFLREFFVVHHFGRGATRMQGHGGSILYHPAVVLFGGTALSTLFLLLLSRRVRGVGRRAFAQYTRWGFPFSWIVAFLTFYSALSTKLPNYTWPVWPAVTLAVCVLLAKVHGMEEVENLPSRFRAKLVGLFAMTLKCLASLGLMFLILSLLLVALAPDQISRHLPLNPKAQVILDSVGPWPVMVRLAIIAVAICICLQLYAMRRVGSKRLSGDTVGGALVKCAALAAVSVAVLGTVIGPFVADVMVGPYARLAEKASSLAGADTCLTTVGSSSPTVSLHYRGGWVNDCRRSSQKFLIGPVWKEESCRENGLVVVARDRYAFLCASTQGEAEAPEERGGG